MPDVATSGWPEPILIAGLGSAGRRHLANLRSLGCSRFVFYRTFRATVPNEPDVDPKDVTDDLQEALSRRPRAAIVANPTALHMDVALAAAEAGCHLFIEKPLSHTAEHCAELADLVERNKLVTMIGCQFRFHPLLISLRAQLHSGRIGDVFGARAEWGEYLPDWHPYEDHRQSYSARTDLGGGAILTLIHPIDYLMWMFGKMQCTVARTRDVPCLETAATDDWAEILLKFHNGATGSVHLDFVQKPPVHRLQVWGNRGRALWDYHAGTLEWTATDGHSAVERVPAGFERNAMFVDEMREFLAAVAAGRDSAIPLADGIAALEVALAAKASAAKDACCA
jgi:predicted dehydrogenase